MRDLKSARLIYLKAGLFLVLGIASGGLLLAEHPSWLAVSLLTITIWAFCRVYYFAFYVIEHYVDSEYKFSGLSSFLRYLATRRNAVR